MTTKSKKETSAGGIVTHQGKVLLVLMNTLNGKKVWTYPKGHIEKKEKKQTAALREVLEETGYKCEITEPNEILLAKYSFFKNKVFIEKEVFWYKMKTDGINEGIKTPEEIEKTLWADYKEAKKLLIYESDLKILEMIKSEIGGSYGI